MKSLAGLAALAGTAGLLFAGVQSAEAHRHGCHRWHSCPSDHATYQWRGMWCVSPASGESRVGYRTRVAHQGRVYYCRRGGAAARTKRIPNVVGMNHQTAQDYLQARGLYNLRERDCTGRGRLLLFDRNWKVVRQTPRAGSRRSTDVRITLCSVKYSD